MKELARGGFAVATTTADRSCSLTTPLYWSQVGRVYSSSSGRPPLRFTGPSDLLVPTPEETTRHHDESAVVYVGAHPTNYTLRIQEPDPAWAQRYDVLAARILTALSDRALGIQHIGSTSVPGLPACQAHHRY